MSDEKLERLYEPCSDDDLVHWWNTGAQIDDMGELEEELMSRGYETRRPNGRRNRRLDAGDVDGWGAFFRENSEYWGGY